MAGQVINDFSEGIWDDGEWISWDWINEQIYQQERQAEFPAASMEILGMFEHLIDVASEYKELTGRYLPLWGELGELYAEIKFGVVRRRPMAQGSDGKLGNDFVEIKTISPEKRTENVHVKRTGNFNKLLVVKISQNFEFDARIIDCRALAKGNGKHASLSWESMPK